MTALIKIGRVHDARPGYARDLSRRSICAVASMVTIACTNSAHAQKSGEAWPARPLRLVIPASPGGGADTLARILSPRLVERFGQPIVIDNRAGASGTIAMELTARAAPDGYTIILTQSTSAVVAPAIYDKLPYDTLRDLSPVTLVAEVPHVLVVNPSVPAANLKELIALAKVRPLNYASSGIGAASHFSGEMLDRAASIMTVHLPYKGAGPALSAVIGGEAQMFSAPINAAIGQLKAGRLRAIAMTTARRSPALPDLPTVAENGFAGFDIGTWFGVMITAKSSRELVERLHREFVAVLKMPEVQERLLADGSVPVGNTPEAFRARIRTDLDRFARIAREAGIKAE
ncbi:MAG: tripartite tricarboxylate transporter substrate binding protein [Proteobacteria bacterium]|nr:tripartite tricarboxylate transporter substrate binding protein [Burkholderiales bacterium]